MRGDRDFICWAGLVKHLVHRLFSRKSARRLVVNAHYGGQFHLMAIALLGWPNITVFYTIKRQE
jgi:hypothetical protein